MIGGKKLRNEVDNSIRACSHRVNRLDSVQIFHQTRRNFCEYPLIFKKISTQYGGKSAGIWAVYSIGDDPNVCIFDDIINRGRNLEHIVTYFHRRSVRKISFASLGYVGTLVYNFDESEKKDFYNVTEYPYWVFVPLNKELIGAKDTYYLCKLKEPFTVKLLCTSKIAFRNGLTLNIEQTKKLSKALNKFIHCCGISYTSYTAYGRFGSGETLYPGYSDLTLNVSSEVYKQYGLDSLFPTALEIIHQDRGMLC
jgi:hypothetical protein